MMLRPSACSLATVAAIAAVSGRPPSSNNRTLPISTGWPLTCERTPRPVTLSSGVASSGAIPSRLRAPDHRLRQGMLRLPLHRCGDLQQFRLATATRGHNVCDLRLPDRQRPGLVQCDRLDRAQVLEVHAAFHQHAATSRLRYARQNRRGRAKR